MLLLKLNITYIHNIFPVIKKNNLQSTTTNIKKLCLSYDPFLLSIYSFYPMKVMVFMAIMALNKHCDQQISNM